MQVFDRDGTSVSLWWPSSGAEKYVLEMEKDGTWETLSGNIKGTTIRKKNLSPETTYSFRVTPVMKNDEMGPSETVTASPTSLKQLEKPKCNDVDGESAIFSAEIKFKFRYSAT